MNSQNCKGIKGRKHQYAKNPVSPYPFCTKCGEYEDPELAAKQRAFEDDEVGAVIAEDAAERAGTCRGDFSLGTACGKCSKCLAEADLHRRNLSIEADDLISKLRANIDNLEAEKYALEDQVKGLRELQKSDEADAKRYRWFRENSLQVVHASKISWVHHLDRAIDALMPADDDKAPAEVFGMNLVVDGNMPDGEIHLSQNEGEPVKLTVLPPGHGAKDAASDAKCKACSGYGTVSTGITECPTTICDKCNGTGTTGKARDV